MNPTERLLEMMMHFGLPVLDQQGKRIVTKSGYEIEVEGNSLFKLIHMGEVIAPFDDMEELCEFVQNYS
jgi:hypothetical protein